MQGVQPVGEVLQDAVVFAAVAGLEEEGVVRVEHELCFLPDLLAGHGEVEARGELEVGPDVLVVHVDYTVVCCGRGERLVGEVEEKGGGCGSEMNLPPFMVYSQILFRSSAGSSSRRQLVVRASVSEDMVAMIGFFAVVGVSTESDLSWEMLQAIMVWPKAMP